MPNNNNENNENNENNRSSSINEVEIKTLKNLQNNVKTINKKRDNIDKKIYDIQRKYDSALRTYQNKKKSVLLYAEKKNIKNFENAEDQTKSAAGRLIGDLNELSIPTKKTIVAIEYKLKLEKNLNGSSDVVLNLKKLLKKIKFIQAQIKLLTLAAKKLTDRQYRFYA
jgi:hypothetical protein